MSNLAFDTNVRRDLAAGVAVMAIRTREPLRVIDSLKMIAIERSYEFWEWNVVEGYRKYNLEEPDRIPPADGMLPIIDAMKYVDMDASSPVGGSNGRAMVALHWPHEPINNLPPLKQLLMQYAVKLPTGHKRVLLIVPPTYTLPEELKEVVVVHDFGTPSREDLSEIYDRSIGASPVDLGFNEDDKNRILSLAAGLTELEAEVAFIRPLTTYKGRMSELTVDRFCTIVAESKTEAVKRSDVLELMDVGSPDDIGGLEELKDWVAKTALCMTPEALEFGIDLPKGVFLAGSPGTGKSLSAKAIAGIMGLPLIKFDVSRVFNSLVGKSEERIKDALKLLNALSPAVVLVDEVDKVFNVNSGGGDSGVGSRVLGTLLTGMQENNTGIFWVVTANRVEGLPPELLRKGRLDETFAVTTPNEEERLAVLQIHLRKRGKKVDDIPGLEEAAAGSADFVPAELEAAVKEALKEAFVTGQELNGQLILKQLGEMKPLKQAFAEQFNAMEEWAANNARMASRQGAERQRRGRVNGRGRTRDRSVGRAIDTASLDG